MARGTINIRSGAEIGYVGGHMSGGRINIEKGAIIVGDGNIDSIDDLIKSGGINQNAVEKGWIIFVP
tara:strand:+ start:480 stop:680 length:201 start_codon:yes stop_codon:yes gene_type:complete